MGGMAGFAGIFTAVVRILLPLCAVFLLIFCGRLLFRKPEKRRPSAAFVGEDGARYPVPALENAIGRSTVNDVCLAFPAVSRRHAVLSKTKEGWRLRDARSKGGVTVNGEPVEKIAWLEFGDRVEFGGVPFRFEAARPCDMPEELVPLGKKKAARAKKEPSAVPALFFLNVFQLLAALSLLVHYAENIPLALPLCFLGLIAVEWVYFGVQRLRGIGVEILAFFLATVGLCVAASAVPASLFKQFAALLLGLAMFWVLSFLLKDIDRTMKLRYLVGGLAVALLAANLIFGEKRGGAQNWINLGFVTVQPSEFVKVAFIFAGCATLERLMTTRNTLLFIAFSGVCIGPLFLMRDFGTAAIFFVAMLIIAYMRSGDWKTIALFSALAVVGAVVIIACMPYVASRFAYYRHAWEFPSDYGYQQTRTMIAIASGGLFGLGGGNGNLDLVAAADTDLVFGFVSEEWGLLVALCCAACLLFFAVYAARRASHASSAYYAIAACAASGMFLFQAALNIFGSTDLLPLTGVTFPLVSNGGSSMAASFAMLAFIKAVGNEPAPRQSPLVQSAGR